MAILDELEIDHGALRGAIVTLRETLTEAETCDIVAARLQSLLGLMSRHLQEEENALIPYGERVRWIEREQALHDHAEPAVVLRDLQVLFSAWRVAPTQTLIIHLCRLLDELREWLDEEQRDIFPALKFAAGTVNAGGHDANP